MASEVGLEAIVARSKARSEPTHCHPESFNLINRFHPYIIRLFDTYRQTLSQENLDPVLLSRAPRMNILIPEHIARMFNCQF